MTCQNAIRQPRDIWLTKRMNKHVVFCTEVECNHTWKCCVLWRWRLAYGKEETWVSL